LLKHITASLKVQFWILKVMVITDAAPSQSSGFNWRWCWSVMMFNVETWWWFDSIKLRVSQFSSPFCSVCTTVYMLVLCVLILVWQYVLILVWNNVHIVCSFLYDSEQHMKWYLRNFGNCHRLWGTSQSTSNCI
jgi:hypothetical protein